MSTNRSWLVILALAISLGTQYLFLELTSLLPLRVQDLDPASDFLYSSVGVLMVLIFTAYFIKQKNWWIVVGLTLGVVLWWPFLGIWMTVTGNWL